jgi:cytochrome P450
MVGLQAQHAAATLDADPFSPEVLTDPYAFHAALRDAGPVVRLSHYGIWAMGRHEQVHAALTDWQTYCSGAGVGLADFRRETPWRPPSLILEADPPLHTRTRGVLARILSPAALRRLRNGFAAAADALLRDLVARGRFDAVRDLAEVYPPQVFGDAVGLGRDGREHLIAYGSMAFNAFGPRNWLVEQSMAAAGPVIAWITAQCRREALSANGFGAQIYAAADAGEITPEEAPLLVRSFLTAGVDTTVNGIGNAIFCLASHPAAWQRLRADPSLARNAFEEALRLESTVQTFFRTTTRPVEVDGTRLGEGEKVLLFLAAANRDPRRWDAPERFDIGRAAAGHVGFGTGIHGCVGQMLARLEGEVVLQALARHAATLTLDGPVQRRLNNTLRALASVPVSVQSG